MEFLASFVNGKAQAKRQKFISVLWHRVMNNWVAFVVSAQMGNRAFIEIFITEQQENIYSKLSHSLSICVCLFYVQPRIFLFTVDCVCMNLEFLDKKKSEWYLIQYIDIKKSPAVWLRTDFFLRLWRAVISHREKKKKRNEIMTPFFHRSALMQYNEF